MYLYTRIYTNTYIYQYKCTFEVILLDKLKTDKYTHVYVYIYIYISANINMYIDVNIYTCMHMITVVRFKEYC